LKLYSLKLTSWERAVCQKVSNAIWKASGGVNEMVASGAATQTEARENNYGAVCAEMAFCRIFGLYPWSILTRPGPGKAPLKDHDTLWRGWRVDVKQTTKRNGLNLRASLKAQQDCDLFVLMYWGPEMVWQYLGWISYHNAFLEAEHRGRPTPHYRVAESQLTLHQPTHLGPHFRGTYEGAR
tara:strand:- start:1975 stop:2520 length:546 start_codon:yes stop_codon:yes gene_type:complete